MLFLPTVMLSDGSYLEQLSHDVLLTIGNDHVAVWSFGHLKRC
jgi:hypothetical protein